MQVWGEYMKYLAAFGSPSLVGTLPEKAQPQVPQDQFGNYTGGPIVYPENQMLNALIDLKNNSVVVVPFGGKIDPLNPGSVEGNFHQAITLCDEQIAKGLLGQISATEIRLQTRASAQAGQDIL